MMRQSCGAPLARTCYVVRRKYQNGASQALRAAKFSSTSSVKKVDAYVQGPKTHFGYEEVSVEQKEGKVKKVFESVADSYDVMNDLMSAGLHRYWKDELVRISGVGALAKAARSSGKQFDILDLAGGTGDVSFRFIDAAECVERSKSSGKDSVSVTVCDINPAMLQVGEKRARERYGNALIDKNKSLSFVEGNAQDLPFDESQFDLFTIAFGLRNVTDVDAALCEARRVLKPGGRFMCLEFSKVENDTLRAIYDTYSFNAIPKIGQVVAGDSDSYQYLVESIRKFSTQEELKDRIEAAGFAFPSYANYTGGIVSIHEGYKPI